LTISERAAASSEARRDCIELPPPICFTTEARGAGLLFNFLFIYLNNNSRY
jgi:hypothetical protein